MPKMIFLNLAVADVARARLFYEALGFENNPMFSNADAAAMIWAETIHVMLLSHAHFARFTTKRIIDPKADVQALFCLSAESRADVDALIAKAGAGGGRIDPDPAQDHGFMYGRSLEDPDGHGFEIMWMDVQAAAQAMAPAAG